MYPNGYTKYASAQQHSSLPPILTPAINTDLPITFVEKSQMPTDIITKEDLHEFRKQLIEDIRQLLNGERSTPQGKWLKSYQVKNLLKISAGTLQNLRVNGTIPFTRIGNIIYYKAEDIHNLLQDGLNARSGK